MGKDPFYFRVGVQILPFLLQILIICFFSALLWVLITCVLWLPVSDLGLLMIRGQLMGVSEELDLSYYGERSVFVNILGKVLLGFAQNKL